MTELSKPVKTIRTAFLACTAMALLASGSRGQVALAAGQAGTSGTASAAATATTATITASPGAYSDDDRALRDQAADYAKFYAAKDAKALASMWTVDGTFTDSKGHEHTGRGEIEAYFSEGFNFGDPQTLDIVITSLKFPAAAVAVEEGTTRIASGPGMGSMGRYLVVHTKVDGKWLMQTCAETDCIATSSAEYLKDLDWLVGNWSVKEQPQAAHLKVSWSKNKTFIICKYIRGEAKDAPIEDLQIIGWDPHHERIAVWHFGASGGFGWGHLSCDGKSWTERAMATEPDGTTGNALYRFTRLGNDTFTWQSSKRSIAGAALPDSKELTITRDNTQ
jgi:uncharacterized protein (TIGR02246 family)